MEDLLEADPLSVPFERDSDAHFFRQDRSRLKRDASESTTPFLSMSAPSLRKGSCSSSLYRSDSARRFARGMRCDMK